MNSNITPTNERLTDTTERNQAWAEISKFVVERVGADTYERWFTNASVFDISDTLVEVIVESDTHQLWVETNYMPELQAAVNDFFGDNHVVSVIVDLDESALVVEDESTKGQKKSNTSKKAASRSPEQEKAFEKKLKASGLNPQFTFNRFVVGHSNEFAHAACSAVAEQRGLTYNPLFIHGSSGMGKTHLMHAIGHERLQRDPDAKVVYMTCEKFTNEFIDAVRKGDLTKFRNRYRNADLLLIDDVQFLAGKERSQEEFFHTFNTLLDLQSQVVLISDRPACEIKNLEPRLVSRFECGLTVEVQQPQMETRMAILQRKMDEWDVNLNEELIEFLAKRIRTNIRRLEGGLVRLATYASLGSDCVSLERAESLLKDILREEGAKQVTISAIQKTVSEHFDVKVSDMTGRRRPANIAYARQVAMYLSRKLTRCSLMEIGEAFGGRDHGTVIHACKKIAKESDNEMQVRSTVEMLDSMLMK